MNPNAILDQVVTKVERYAHAGRTLPPWLEKQAKAVYLILDGKLEHGIALLVDGFQDEKDFLEDWLT